MRLRRGRHAPVCIPSDRLTRLRLPTGFEDSRGQPPGARDETTGAQHAVMNPQREIDATAQARFQKAIDNAVLLGGVRTRARAQPLDVRKLQSAVTGRERVHLFRRKHARDLALMLTEDVRNLR